MDTSDPDIYFDEQGNCNNCNTFLEEVKIIMPKGKKRENKFQELLKEIKSKGKNNKYDCLIGMSGGVDSTYLAHLLKQNNLRPLAMHMDNGWNSKIAVKNIMNICTKLEIDYVSKVLDWEEFKNIQLAFLKSSIVEVEMPTDHAIAGSLHQVASKYNIKYIIGGGNYSTEGILPQKWFYDPKDLVLIKSLYKKFFNRKIVNLPLFDFKREIYYKFLRNIKIVYPLNLVDYNKVEVLKLLKKDYSYEEYGGKHHESIYTKFVQSYLQPTKFNLDYRKATYSSMICSQQLTREQALKDLVKSPYDAETIEKDKNYISKKLGITHEELNIIISSDAKSYKNYPNNEKFLTFLYKIYRVLFR